MTRSRSKGEFLLMELQALFSCPEALTTLVEEIGS